MVPHPDTGRTTRSLISAVNMYAGTVSIRIRDDGGVIRGGGTSESSVRSVPFNDFLSTWLQLPTPRRFSSLVRRVLPSTGSRSHQFGLNRLSELQESQVDALRRTMEIQHDRQTAMFANESYQRMARAQTMVDNLEGGMGSRKVGERVRERGKEREEYEEYEEPVGSPPPLPTRGARSNVVAGVVVENRSARSGTINDLDCLTDDELKTMTSVSGWSDRELRALARIRRSQQQRRQHLQARQSHESGQPWRRVPRRPLRFQQERNGAHLPGEDDMLNYTTTHDAAVETMDDVFMFGGGLPRQLDPNANPFDNETGDERRDEKKGSGTTTTTTTKTTKRRNELKVAMTRRSGEDSSRYMKRMERIRNDRESGASRECSICLDTIDSRGDARMLTCAHTFHHGCVEEWLARSNVCPLCRTEQ